MAGFEEFTAGGIVGEEAADGDASRDAHFVPASGENALDTSAGAVAPEAAMPAVVAPAELAIPHPKAPTTGAKRPRGKHAEDDAARLSDAADQPAEGQAPPPPPREEAKGEKDDGKADKPEGSSVPGGDGGDDSLLLVGGVVVGAAVIGAALGGGGGSSGSKPGPVNAAPVATADSYSTNEDTTLTVAASGVLGNDTDADGNSLTAVLVTGPAHGSLTLNPNGSFSYTPAANYNGADSFTYKVNDGTVDGNTVTVSLTVNPINDLPVASPNTYAGTEDTTLTVAAPGVLGNDTDVDGNTLSAILVSGPANGTLALNANGSFAYTPRANFNGADSFTYKVNDGTADGNTVTVTLNIAAVNDAPVAAADAYTTSEDTTLTVAAAGVLANDTDIDGNALSAILVSGPAHGALTLNANGSFVYTPNTNYNGADSFTYKVNDGTADGNTVTVNLTVSPVNDAPVAVANAYSTNEDTALTIAAPGVLGNDTDVDGNPLTAALVSGPANGTLTFSANGSFVYTPNANYNGADSFTYKVNDGTVDGNTVTVSLTVNPVNDAPVAVANAYSTNEDTALTIAAPGVLGNDTDVDGDPLTAALVAGPANGTLTLNANGSFVYTPNANYNGADSFTYKVNDGTVDGNTVTVSLTVNAVNDAPVAVADSYSTNEDTTLTVPAAGVLANDTDVEGNPLTAALVSGPAHGSLVFNANGSFSYTPSANYNGADSFTYKVNDGTVDGNTVTVSLTVNPVNDAPVATGDAYATNEDTALTIAAPGVLANDTDVEGSALSAVLVSGPANGTLTLNANGSFVYTPNANYNGPDSFSYRPNDGTADGNTVTVSLTVNPVNDAPVAVANAYSTNEDTALTIAAPGVLGNDSDVDGNALSAILVLGPANGTLTFNANGSFVYTPNTNYNGADSFTYKVNDGTVDGNTVTVSLTVNPVNDAPVAVANAYSTNEDTALTIAAPGVLGNDTDVDGDPLTAALVTGPANGTLTLNANGSFVYTPNANYNGADSFTYKVNDGTVDGNTVTVSLTVNPVNDLPVATADSYTTGEDTTLNVAAPGVLANDTDVEGSALAAVLVSGPANGSVTLNADGSFAYTPNPNYNGIDSFTYRANDGTSSGNVVSVNLTVTAVNDAPVAGADAYSTNEDTVLNVGAPGVLANDVDADGNPITAILVSGPAKGSLTFNANGSFSYAPNANYNGADSFTYKVNDGTVDGNTVTVSLTVNPVNDAPVAVGDSYSTNEDTVLTVPAPGLLANDTDVEGNPLTAVLVSGPANGALVFNADGSFSYTPNANYNGADSFTYKVNDGTADGNTVTVSLTVNPVNDAPVATGDAYTTNEDTALTIAAPGVLGNDTDIDGNPLTAALVTGPANGTLTFNANGSFVYTPNANYNGADSFTYKVNDGTVDGNTVTVNLTVNPVNDAPVTVADAYGANQDTALVVAAAAGVLANDSDIDGNALSAILVTDVANGTLALGADGSFTYTPNAGFFGADSFTYKANDGTADGNTVTVNLTVAAANMAPTASADSYSTSEDTALTVAAPGVLANDSDPEGGPLTAVVVSGPANGSLTLNANGSFSYTPNANYNGADSFTYKVNDGTVDGNTVTVSLTVNAVNDAPVAVADSYSTNEDTTLTVPAAGVLANDTDVEGNPLTAALVSGPAHGSLVFNANGSFSYTPSANYNGADSFTYKVNDGTVDGNTVTVSLTVNPVNDAPVATGDAYATNEDTALTIAAPGVLANDTDVEGSALSAVLVSGPANGTLTLNANGSFVYTPNANYNGADSFTYKVNDGTVDGNTVTVSLTVNPVNDAPVAVANAYSTNEDTALTIAAPGVLGNDSDVDGNALSAILVSGPANGTLTFNANGSFVYTPNANYNGADSFTYKVNDGTVDGNTVTVSLTVNPVNDAPVAVANAYSTNEDTALTIAAPGVLGNDTDVDGDPLTAALVTGPANGTLTLNGNGSFVYTPNANYNGADSFTYKVNDGTVDGNTVTVSLTVNPVNDAPVANADSATASEDVALTVPAATGVLANDTDVDGNPLTVSAVNGSAASVGTQITLASGALLTLNANGSYTYNPNGTFEALRPTQTATDSFSYTVSDGSLTDTATATITIQGANEAPVATADTYNGITGNTPISYSAAQGVLANDTDPDQPPAGLSVSQVNGTAIGGNIAVTGGVVNMNADGSFTFTPATGYQGAASFNYTVRDADGGTDTKAVTLNVAGQVWYVDNAYAGENGASDGSYLRPFTNLGQLNDNGTGAVGTVGPNDGIVGDDDVDGAGDTIFVYNNATPYTSGITLENNQTLRGDGTTFTVNGHAIGGTERTAGIDNVTTNSVIGQASGTIVTLGSGNTLTGVTIGANSGTATAIAGTNFGTMTVNNAAIDSGGQALSLTTGTVAGTGFTSTSSDSGTNNVALTGVGGTLQLGAGSLSGSTGTGALSGALMVNGGTVSATYSGGITQATANAALVNVNGGHSGTVTLTGNLSATNGTGAQFDNADGTYQLTGTGSLAGGDAGIDILNGSGGTFNFGESGVTSWFITSPTGTAFNVDSSTANVTYAGGITQANNAALSSITNHSAGTISFVTGFSVSNLSATNGTGLQFNNADGTYNFNSTATLNGGNAGIDILTGSDGTFNFNGNTSITNPTGDAFVMSASNGTVTYGGTISDNTGNAVNIDNNDAGNVTFNGAITTNGLGAAGISVTNSNTAGTIAFNGPVSLTTSTSAAVTLTGNTGKTITFAPSGTGLDISTTSGTGLVFTGGGTLNVIGAGNTVSTSTGALLQFQNGNIGSGDIQFASLTSSGTVAGVGIELNNVDGGVFNGGNVTLAGSTSQGIAIVGGSAATFNFTSATIDNAGPQAILIGNAGNGVVTFATVDIDGVAGDAVSINGNTSAVNINGGTIGATNDPGGDAVFISGGSAAINIGASITKNGLSGSVAGNAVEVTGRTAGTVTLSGNVTDTSTFAAANGSSGIYVHDNTGGTVNFTGATIALNTNTNNAVNLATNTGAAINFAPVAGGNGLDIVTTSGAGFTATSGGTVTVTQNSAAAPASNSITATTGTAVNIANTTIGAAGVTFQSITSNGAVNGIVLNTTGSGAFTVTGDGSTTAGVLDRDGSGGTIQNTTGDGIVLTNANNVTLRQMNLIGNGDPMTPGNEATEATTTAGEHTIEVVGGSNLILSSLSISDPGADAIFASELGGINRINGDTVITGLLATAGHAIYTSNSTTSAALIQLDNVDITNSASNFSTVYVTNGGAANVRFDVKNGTFTNLGSQAITAAAGSTAGTTGTLTTSISGSLFKDGRDLLANGSATGENNVGILVTNGARHIALVSNNTFDNVAEDGSIANTSVIRTQNSGGRMDVTIDNNKIQNITYATGGRNLIGHVFEPVAYNASDYSNVSIINNTVTNIDYVLSYREFVFVDFRTTASGGDVIIANNTVTLDPTNLAANSTQQAIEFRARQTNASTVDLLIENNNLTVAPIAVDIIDVDAEDGATVNATIRNNTITANGATGDHISVAAEDGVVGGLVGNLNASITGNTLNDTDGTRTIELAEIGGPPAGNLNVTQASAAAVQAANPNATPPPPRGQRFGRTGLWRACAESADRSDPARSGTAHGRGRGALWLRAAHCRKRFGEPGGTRRDRCSGDPALGRRGRERRAARRDARGQRDVRRSRRSPARPQPGGWHRD